MRAIGCLTFLLAFLVPLAAARAEQPEPAQDDLRVLAEGVLNAQLVDIPTGRLTAAITQDYLQDFDSICGHDPLPRGHSVLILAHAQEAGFITLQLEGISRTPVGIIHELLGAQQVPGMTRHVIVTETDAGREADASASLPPEQRIANCIRFPKGVFTAGNFEIRPAHGGGTSIDPQYRIAVARYDAQWSAPYRAMGEMREYPDQAMIGLLVHVDPADGHWKLVKWTTRSVKSREPMTFLVPRTKYEGSINFH